MHTAIAPARLPKEGYFTDGVDDCAECHVNVKVAWNTANPPGPARVKVYV
jgi:hypothetical protein